MRQRILKQQTANVVTKFEFTVCRFHEGVPVIGLSEYVSRSRYRRMMGTYIHTGSEVTCKEGFDWASECDKLRHNRVP